MEDLKGMKRSEIIKHVKETTKVDIPKKDTIVKVRFQNSENPKGDVPFTYEGIGYHLYDGRTYDLPKSVVNHLNNLTYPIKAWVRERPEDEQAVLKVVGQTHRFNCIVIEI